MSGRIGEQCSAVPSRQLGTSPEVWMMALDHDVDESVLDASEVARGERFRFERDRRRFRRRRAHLRHVLAAYTGRPAAELRWVTGVNGKPALEEPGVAEFSATSSGDIAAIAVGTPGRALGLDLEMAVPTPDQDDVARALFADEEVAAIRTGADFLRCWTRKEAYVKAVGLGLSLPLDSFAMEVQDVSAPRLLRSTTRPADVHLCTVTDLSPRSGEFAAALVAFGPVPRVIMRSEIVFRGEHPE